MSIQLYGRVPYIPEETLRKHQVYESSDNRWRAAARMQQALFREKQGWAIGSITSGNDGQRSLGNYLTDADDQKNFISADVARLMHLEFCYRERSALIDDDRMRKNLLSSGPACANFFGPLKLNLRLATAVFKKLFPDYVSKVTAILFEHSPARKSIKFLDDRTAFDVLIKIITPAGRPAFLATEFKFSESLQEQPARLRPRYDEVSLASGLYVDPYSEALRTVPLQQLWRQHMLASTMIANGLYPEGRFVVCAPQLNEPAWDAFDLYRQQLSPTAPIPFETIPWERLTRAIQASGARDIASALTARYLDLNGVEALI